MPTVPHNDANEIIHPRDAENQYPDNSPNSNHPDVTPTEGPSIEEYDDSRPPDSYHPDSETGRSSKDYRTNPKYHGG